MSATRIAFAFAASVRGALRASSGASGSSSGVVRAVAGRGGAVAAVAAVGVVVPPPGVVVVPPPVVVAPPPVGADTVITFVAVAAVAGVVGDARGGPRTCRAA